MNILKTPLVLVSWQDACCRQMDVDSPDDIEEKELGVKQHTVGYLLKKSKKWIVVAQSWAENGIYGEVYEIPRSIVLKIRILDEEKPQEIHDQKT